MTITIRKIGLILTIWLINFAIFSRGLKAKEDSFINIVNPIRISKYNSDPVGSFLAQEKVLLDRNLRATWLITYDVLADEQLVNEIKKMNRDDHELGIFMEISNGLAAKSGVSYNSDSLWHHAKALFLVGYSQEDRIKIIDEVFKEFRENIGYYPKAVGAWWIDSYSLNYMNEKYGVIVNLGLADQFYMDGYKVWGTPWSTPFYPNKINSGMPGMGEDKLQVLTLEWAYRDPFLGYESSLYSTQDYAIGDVGYDTSYFKKLLDVYLERSKLRHVVVGLEGDLEKGAYDKEFAKQMDVVSDMAKEGVQIVTMSEYAQWYKNNYSEGMPLNYILAPDIGEQSGQQVLWVQSVNYRAGMRIDENIEIFDFRVYPDNYAEPFYKNVISEFKLIINMPSVIDELTDNNSIWRLDLGKFKDIYGEEGKVVVEFERGEMRFEEDKAVISGLEEIAKNFVESNLVKVEKEENKIVLLPVKVLEYGPEGYMFSDLSIEATHNLQSTKKQLMFGAVLFVILLLCLFWLKQRRYGGTVGLILIVLAFSYYEYQSMLTEYMVNQEELIALDELKAQDKGRVLVFDKECLQCDWNGEARPAVFANKRGYVSKFSDKDIVYNYDLFVAKNQEEYRAIFDTLNVDYIYIVKYGNYIEKLPFSPGDIGVTKIYENAGSEIWKSLK